MRLGDLDALKEIIETYRPIAITSDYLQGKNNMVDYCIAEIDNAPIVEPEITEKQAILFLINNGWLVNHDKELREKWERPQGEWIIDSDNLPICKECGEVALQRVFVKMPHLIQEVRMVKSNFCPNCGAKMRGAEE